MLGKYWLMARAFPKTLYFNLKYFPLKTAIRFPVIVSHRVLLNRMKGSITVENPHTGMIRIGFGNVGIFDRSRSRCIWDVSGHVRFGGKAHIGHGSKIIVEGGAILDFGEWLNISAESEIVCGKKISFGNNVNVSWNTLFMDTDFHPIYSVDTGQRVNENNEINIGDDVWVGARCVVLKGSTIGNKVIVAANSTVSGKVDAPENSVVGGSPVRVLKTGVRWEM